MRLSAEENWKRRRGVSDVRCGADAESGDTVPEELICHSSASSVVSPLVTDNSTVVETYKRVCADEQSVVSRLVSLTFTNLFSVARAVRKNK